MNINNQLDEQRIIYMYQCFNALMGLLDKHINENSNDTYNQNEQTLKQKTYIEFKAGNISREQYEQIIYVLMNNQ